MIRALLPWQRRASFRLPRKNPHKYNQSCSLERPLPDLSAKEYQLLYKREYLKNQPLTKALDSKSTSLVYLQLFKESTPHKGP
jgi:hypothetical protein